MFLLRPSRARNQGAKKNQQGYILLAVMLAATLMLIALSAETQRLGQQIRREREEELIHRGKQYVRAIKLYYKKFGTYPTTIEQLEKANNIRFLRQRYKDPMTGDDDWRLIHVGEAKPIKIKGLGGAPAGSSSGQSGAIGPGVGGSSGLFGGAGGSTLAGQATGAGAGQTTGQGAAGSDAGPGSSTNSDTGQPIDVSTIAKPLGSGKTYGGGPIVGIASISKKKSIKELNKNNHYNEWEFVYDPRYDVNTGVGSPIGPGTAIGGPGIGPSSPMQGPPPGAGPMPIPIPTSGGPQ